jgi:amino-acid N-acetyltransferase
MHSGLEFCTKSSPEPHESFPGDLVISDSVEGRHLATSNREENDLVGTGGTSMSHIAWTSARTLCPSHLPSTNIAAETLRTYLLSHRCSPSLKHRSRSRHYSAEAKAEERHGRELHHGPEQDKNRSLTETARQRQANKEFFTSLLSSAATKRDAKAYISRLKTTSGSPQNARTAQSKAQSTDLLGRTRASDASPVFTQYTKEVDEPVTDDEPLHVALVKLSNVSSLAEDVLTGIAQTLSSLSRLSMGPCVVLEEGPDVDPQKYRQKLANAADRLAAAIDNVHETGVRTLDNVLSFDLDGRPQVLFWKLLTRPLRRGRIPVVLPVAYSAEQARAVSIGADEAVLALTKGLTEEENSGGSEGLKNVSVDRIIVIDDSGSIPNTKSVDKRHVFINLDQEYSTLQEELRSSTGHVVSQKHASNLRMFKDALKVLPSSSSGLLTTPQEAANPASLAEEGVLSVGTRRQKNLLIHNLLTDKPVYSSSLPTGRLGQDTSSTPIITSTVVKRGMPVTVLPHPDAQTWTPNSTPRLRLTDSRVDLARLTHLIDDSFNRQLDVDAYLDRVNDRIAGVIIAGDYEGGAILTWETPPGCSDTDTDRLVPYLDKFAVLKKSQGAGGVADIVFNAMVRGCFPTGVCWRSRKDNPVNKWYFERSRGTWKIPTTNWTMFWTTPGIFVDGPQSRTFADYEGVCRTVQPTWADGKKVVD